MVIFDEAAFIPNLNELYWGILPILNDSPISKLAMITTPKDGSFFNSKFKLVNGDGVIKRRITYDKIPARFSKQLMSDTWDQEILAEIV